MKNHRDISGFIDNTNKRIKNFIDVICSANNGDIYISNIDEFIKIIDITFDKFASNIKISSMNYLIENINKNINGFRSNMINIAYLTDSIKRDIHKLIYSIFNILKFVEDILYQQLLNMGTVKFEIKYLNDNEIETYMGIISIDKIDYTVKFHLDSNNKILISYISDLIC